MVRLLMAVASMGAAAYATWRSLDGAGRTLPQMPWQGKGRGLDAEQARAILGVSASATHDEIQRAHRRLMANLHPDKGGSEYLARQINCARDVLLKR